MVKSPDVKKWTEAEIAALRMPGFSNATLAKDLGRTVDSVCRKRKRLGIVGYAKSNSERATAQGPQPNKPQVEIELPKPEFGYLPLAAINSGEWQHFGLVGDTHLCCKEERLAELHNFYDLLAEEGIKTVFHAGNIVDGYIPKINGGSVYETSIDGQCHYVVDNYPKRKGITTYYITGDDHEGWWQKEGFNFGAYLQFLAQRDGREDLRYIGHVESDVELHHKGGTSTIIKIQHPGGGSAYARSYAAQKQVESWEGGEKPNILVQGHYHVSGFFQERNVHVVSLPGWQDQTIFGRKKRLRMEIGGAILSIKTSPKDGTVTRCRTEFVRYFTRSYYKSYLRSDARILKGHLVLN